MHAAPVSVSADLSLVTLAEAKAHLRVLHSHEDGLIANYVKAAGNYIEEYTGRVIKERQWRLTAASLADREVLPLAPVTSVVSIKYIDTDGNEQTLDAAAYRLYQSAIHPILEVVDSWPETADRDDAWTITVNAGYSTVPESIRVAALLIVGELYVTRQISGPSNEVPFAVKALLQPYCTHPIR